MTNMPAAVAAIDIPLLDILLVAVVPIAGHTVVAAAVVLATKAVDMAEVMHLVEEVQVVVAGIESSAVEGSMASVRQEIHHCHLDPFAARTSRICSYFCAGAVGGWCKDKMKSP
jgi:hypothetical protein